MRAIPGGTFLLGSDHDYPEEAPARLTEVGDFLMDTHPVTVGEFAAFVEATGHVTTAECAPDPSEHPGADPALLVPGSLVFTPTAGRVPLDDFHRWWRYVPGAQWRHPEGPGSDVNDRRDHPVVHVSYDDAAAYARWAGKALPTEAEWERAARGGHEGRRYAWGDELTPGGRRMANTWHGGFPWCDDDPDGYPRTSPVGFYPANDFGLADMIGNVWEWTASPATASHRGRSAHSCCAPGGVLPAAFGGPAIESPATGGPPRKTIKGGSHLCAPEYCRRYRPAARQGQDIDTSTSHIGFRCVRRPRQPSVSGDNRPR